jgi:ribose transport system permease protein
VIMSADNKSNAKRSIKLPAETGIALVLLAVLLAGYAATPNFLTVSNILILLLNGAVIGFLCVGQTFVLLTGGIDLSCGSIVAMTCVLAALLMQSLGLPWPAAVVLTLLAGALAGGINGLLIVGTGVPPFIVTFAMMGVAASIPQIITGAESIRVSDLSYRLIGQSRILGVPFPVIALAIATVAASQFLRRTVTGTHI